MDFDVCIVGAGVVGLACAAECSSHGLSTIVVERHPSFGQDTSSRNSEVIHSGIYYPAGSLKAKLCVTANRNLYVECERLGVWTKAIGKLIVAVKPEEIPALERLYQNGVANGIEQIDLLDAQQVKSMEPHIIACRAIWLPTTGIIDSHELMRAYLTIARQHGAELIYNTALVGVEPIGGGYQLTFRDAHGESSVMNAQCVINAAGLCCDQVAALFGIDIDAAGYRLHRNRGHYYAVSSTKSKLVSHLIYPMPDPQTVFLGTHITLDKSGRMKLGPDTEYLDPSVPESEWYKFDDRRKEKFYRDVHQYFPALEMADLSPDQVGIRPKLVGSESTLKDFIIAEESSKRLPGLINLINIESPGLTCAREIAREVVQLLPK